MANMADMTEQTHIPIEWIGSHVERLLQAGQENKAGAYLDLVRQETV